MGSDEGSGGKVAFAVLAVGALTLTVFRFFLGGSTPTTITAPSLRLTTTRVGLASTTITFSTTEPVVKDQGDTVRVDYTVEVENRTRHSVVWKSGQQHLELENKQTIPGVHETVRIAADSHREMTLSFEVGEEDRPVALQLKLMGKKKTIRLAMGLPATPSSSPST